MKFLAFVFFLAFSGQSNADSKFLGNLYMGNTSIWKVNNTQVNSEIDTFEANYGKDKSFFDSFELAFYVNFSKGNYIGANFAVNTYGVFISEGHYIEAMLTKIGVSYLKFFEAGDSGFFIKTDFGLAESGFLKKVNGVETVFAGTKLGYILSFGGGYRLELWKWLGLSPMVNFNYADTTTMNKSSWIDFGLALSVAI